MCFYFKKQFATINRNQFHFNRYLHTRRRCCDMTYVNMRSYRLFFRPI